MSVFEDYVLLFLMYLIVYVSVVVRCSFFVSHQVQKDEPIVDGSIGECLGSA